MQVTRVPVLPSADVPATRAIQAGRQFEGILLNMVFGDLERTFSQLPGSTPDAVSKSYEGFAMEALTSALASHGGIGVAQFIAKALLARAKSAPSGV